MSELILTQDLTALVDQWLEAEQNGEKFPVPFDAAWQIAGYSRKDSAKRKLVKLSQGEDYHLSTETSGGRPEEKILLTCDAMKHFCLMAETDIGYKLRKYMIQRLSDMAFLFKMRNSYTKKDRSGFVYLVSQVVNNYYKIGKSTNPYIRLQSLQVGTPLELKIIERYFSFDCHKLESLLHDYYSAYWVRGEWFELPSPTIKEFLSVARMLDDKIEQDLIAQGFVNHLVKYE